MRRNIIIALIASLISIVASWLYIDSFQQVSITYDRSQGSITLEGNALEKPLTIISNQEMKLKKGSYRLVISGTNVKQTTEDLTVGSQPVKKTVYIPLDDAYLKKQLETENVRIQQAITDRYPLLTNLYTINEGKLYGRGEWYGTTLTYKGLDSDNRDTLRILLKKSSDKWSVASTPPTPLLSTQTFKETPSYILRDINQPAFLPGTASSPAIQPK